LTVRFESPRSVDGVWVLPAAGTNTNRRITSVAVEADGQAVATGRPAELGSTITFAPRVVEELTIRVLATEGAATGRVGLAEVRIDGLDLVPALRLPDDVDRAAVALPALGDALAEAPTAWILHRQQGPYGEAAETWLRRRFTVAAPSTSVVLEGVVLLDESTPGWATEALAGVGQGVRASSVAEGVLGGAGVLAVDGDATSGWLAPATEGAQLQIDTDGAELGVVAVSLRVAPSRSSTDVVVIAYGDEQFEVAPTADGCDVTTGRCTATATADLSGLSGDELTITLQGVRPVRNDGLPGPIEVVEVTATDADLRVDLDAPLDASCRDDLVAVDEGGIPVRLTGTVSELLAGARLPFAGCAPIELQEGEHVIGPVAGPVVDRMSLRTEGFSVAADVPSTAGINVIQRTPTEVRLEVNDPQGGLLIGGMSSAKGWKAWVDGEPLGVGRGLDAQAAWDIPPGTSAVTMRYGPHGLFQLSMAGMLLGLVTCLVLAVGLLRPVREDVAGSRTSEAGPTSSP